MNDNKVKLNKKYVFNTGVSAYTSTYNRIVIYADYFMQGGNRMVQGGGLYTHCFEEAGEEGALSMAVGGAYRWKDAFIPIIKIYTHRLVI
jgi:hypothetical protein